MPWNVNIYWHKAGSKYARLPGNMNKIGKKLKSMRDSQGMKNENNIPTAFGSTTSYRNGPTSIYIIVILLKEFFSTNHRLCSCSPPPLPLRSPFGLTLPYFSLGCWNSLSLFLSIGLFTPRPMDPGSAIPNCYHAFSVIAHEINLQV